MLSSILLMDIEATLTKIIAARRRGTET